MKLKEHSMYYNLGAWIKDCTYISFDGQSIELNSWK